MEQSPFSSLLLSLLDFSLFSTDPSVNLNFSIFLYNSGERKDAAKQFNVYERKMESYRSVKGVEIDQEVSKIVISSARSSAQELR